MKNVRAVLLNDGSYTALGMRLCLKLEGFGDEDITEVPGTVPEITIFEGKEKRCNSRILAHISAEKWLETVRSNIRVAIDDLPLFPQAP